MNLRSNFALTVAGLGAIASTGVLLFSKESNEAPAPEPQHRELTRHWFKKEVNPNGNKVWRRNKWSWYNGKKKEGRAYNYYYDRPGWTPNPNREINIQRRKARGGGGDRNRALCSCTFRDNDGIEYDAMRPAIFGDDYICGACQGSGAFKMAVMNLIGIETASKYFPCPSPAGATSADLTRADYYRASVADEVTFYTAPEVDFSSCPEDTESETIRSNADRQLVITSKFADRNDYLDSACDDPDRVGVVRNVETNRGDRNDSGSTRWTLEIVAGDSIIDNPEVKIGDQVYVKNLYNGEEWFVGFNEDKMREDLSTPQPVLVKGGETAGYTTIWTIESLEGKTGAVHPQDKILLQADDLYLVIHQMAWNHGGCQDNPNEGAYTAIGLRQAEENTGTSHIWAADYV